MENYGNFCFVIITKITGYINPHNNIKFREYTGIYFTMKIKKFRISRELMYYATKFEQMFYSKLACIEMDQINEYYEQTLII